MAPCGSPPHQPRYALWSVQHAEVNPVQAWQGSSGEMARLEHQRGCLLLFCCHLSAVPPLGSACPPNGHLVLPVPVQQGVLESLAGFLIVGFRIVAQSMTAYMALDVSVVSLACGEVEGGLSHVVGLHTYLLGIFDTHVHVDNTCMRAAADHDARVKLGKVRAGVQKPLPGAFFL
jgi:hypothetical protein